MSLQKTLKIDPSLFSLNGRKKRDKGTRSRERKPIIDEENSSKVNKIKRELMKKIQKKNFEQQHDKNKDDK